MRSFLAFLLLLLFSSASAQQTPPPPVTTVNTPIQIDMRSYQIVFPGFNINQLQFTYSDPLPIGSSVVKNPNQQFLVTYTPAPNFVGTGSFEVKICTPTTPATCFDSKINPRTGETTPRPFPVKVIAAANQPPIFSGRTLNLTLGNTLSTVLNAQDPNGDPITYTLLTASPLPVTQATVQLSGNILEISAAGSQIQLGTDFVTVQASDGVNTVNATFTVNVQPQSGGGGGGGSGGGGGTGNVGDNQPPRFINNPPGAVILRNLTVNAGQTVEDVLGIVNWDENGLITRQQEPSKGTFTVIRSQNNTLQVIYTAAASASGNDTFSIVLSDDDGGLTINYSITITNGNGSANNRPPVATATQRSLSLNTNSFSQGNLLTLFGVSDPDNDPLRIALQTTPTLGSLTLNDPALGDFRYAAAATAGNETLTFVVSDGRGGQVTLSLLVTVNPVNPPPSPPSVANTLVNLKVILGRLYRNNAFAQAGADSRLLAVSVLRFPVLGALSLDIRTGEYTYQPNNQSGLDSFILRFTSVSGAQVDVTFALTLEVNLPPTVQQSRLRIEVPTNQTYSSNIFNQVMPQDPNGDTLLLSASEPPTLGKLTINPGTGEYFYAASGSENSDLFVLRFTDPSGASVDVPIAVSIVLPSSSGGGALAGWQLLLLLPLLWLRRRLL
jgi:hypothetical protein